MTLSDCVLHVVNFFLEHDDTESLFLSELVENLIVLGKSLKLRKWVLEANLFRCYSN